MAGREAIARWQGVLGLPCMSLVPAGRARFATAGWLTTLN